MPRGLIVRDRDSGRVKLDTTTNVGTMLGMIDTGGAGSAQTGQIYNALLAEGTPFYFVINGPIQFARESVYPTFWFEGYYLKWSYPSPQNQYDYQRPPCRLLYGIT